ncbi:MAG: aminomethyl-transferring glycine dehydrogenase subunit GcvPB [Elusimicrobiota bacterium]
MKLIYEKSSKGRRGFTYGRSDIPQAPGISEEYCRSKDADLPELSELEVVRHFTRLSNLNYSVDTNFYPLGSCTMKYNPKVLEDISVLEGFTQLHPYWPLLDGENDITQGALRVLYELQVRLAGITGMDDVTLQPLAGAHGELAGMLIIRAYHSSRGETRKYVIVPDESHGTNPASASMAGYEVITIPTSSDGQMDITALKENLTSDTAAVIMTCPNTLGIFDTNISEICSLAHSKGAVMYCDGANMNAILGKVRPGDIGFDIVHINLHKTFATPHGGGGPGAGPVAVKSGFKDFLPVPKIYRTDEGRYAVEQVNYRSIGRISPFYGNFSVLLKAYAYITLLGKDGLIDAGEKAVLNANYLMTLLKEHYELPYNRRCMHEFVLSAVSRENPQVRAVDIAKYLIDRGFHPPTVYFPLIVKEAMMIEPTETESKETLDSFAEAMIDAARLRNEDPEKLMDSPRTRCIKRPDETRAARCLNVNYSPDNEE